MMPTKAVELARDMARVTDDVTGILAKYGGPIGLQAATVLTVMSLAAKAFARLGDLGTADPTATIVHALSDDGLLAAARAAREKALAEKFNNQGGGGSNG